MKIPTLAKVCGRRPGAPEMFYRVNPYLFLVKPRRDVGFKLRAQGRSGTTRTGWKRRLGAGVKNPGAGGGRTLARGQKRAVWPDSGRARSFSREGAVSCPAGIQEFPTRSSDGRGPTSGFTSTGTLKVATWLGLVSACSRISVSVSTL